MYNDISIGQMCKTIREENGISQREMAKILNTNSTEISFIERGFIPKEETIKKIIKIYIENENE